MKVIIAYASAGSGHFKAAESVHNYFKQQNHKNLQLQLINVLEKSNILFSNIYTYGYAFIINYAPWLWGLGFKVTYAKPWRKIIRGIRFIINRLNTKNFAQFLIKENPDFIISTHFLPSEIAAYLKRNKKINSQIFTVITDFGIHPFWIIAGTDMYIVASDFTKEELIDEGIREEKIKAIGIPVDPKFLRPYEKNILCKKLSLDKNRFTVLVVTGSFGIGPIEKIIDLLHQDVQILVVCAKNKKLFLRLKNKNYPQVKVFGFIDNIQELMAASDMIITKPGGLTISEILAIELVPIFISEISGQESENIRILAKYGIGLSIKDTPEIKDIILEYKSNPKEINKIKENIRKIKKPFAAQELYNVICQGGIRDSG